MLRVRTALPWFAAGSAMLGAGFVPVARVPLMGDDFHAFLFTYGEVRGSASQALAYGWRAGQQAGHFNPFGQALGALFHYVSYALPAATGLPARTVAVLAGATLIWGTALAVAWCTAWGLRHAGVVDDVLLPRCFAVTAAVLGASLQLHPWSNDPVSSFLMAGWASALLGFVVLGAALRAVAPGRSGWSDVVWLGVLGVLAVLWYEMLAGVVVGVAAVLVVAGIAVWRSRGARAVGRVLALLGSGVVVPAVVFVAGRFLSAGQQRGYTGTDVALGRAALRSTWAAFVGVLPGGGWPYLITSAGPPHLDAVPAALTLLYALALAGVVRLSGSRVPVVPDPRGLVAPALGAAVAWGATTATQTLTLKYASEIRVAGQVYMYHVVALGSLAVIVALAVVAASGRWRGPRAAGTGAAAAMLVGAFVLVQLTVAWHLSDFLRGAFDGNRELTAAAVDASRTPDARCAVLVRWADRPWPDYYRSAVVIDVQRTYQARFGEPFCVASSELDRVLAAPSG